MKSAIKGKNLAGNMAGGTHHAHFSYGSGYCIFNDLAICAIKAVREFKEIEKVLIIDLDVHQGDGTATILETYKNIFTFSILAVLVQLVFDFLFYLIFMALPKGHNHMLDLFKDWAKYAKADALWGDSILVIVGVILSSFLNQQSFDFNMFTLIFSLYLVPYIIHMKD